jgi:hypothetical protein
LLGRRLLAAILYSSWAACGPSPAPAPPATHVAALDPLEVRLSVDAASLDRYAQRVLYTWTTPDQIAELQRTNQLLVRDESPAFGASYSDIFIHALAEHGDATAQLLDTTTYARARHAWVSPWATRLGWPGEVYGDELIRITLKADAIVLAVTTAKGTFEARTLDNQPVATIDPAKIAAVYFVGNSTQGVFDIHPPTVSYREYIVVNESMIESWEVDTGELKARLADDADLVDDVARYLAAHPRAQLPDLLDAWRGNWTGNVRTAGVLGAYASALALDSPFYRDPKQLAQLATALRQRSGTPMSGRPTAQFPGVGPRRPPPRIVPGNPTYGRLIRPQP